MEHPVRCQAMARLSGALIAVLLVLTACGARPTSQPSVNAAGGSPAPVGSVASPSLSASPSATVETPAEVPEGQQFTLDDVAEFDDGLVIEVAGTVAEKAAKTDRGAEATNGEIVIASVRIRNNTKESYDAASVLIGAKYGDGKDAQIIIDQTDELQSGFPGKIKPKDEDIATVGFAVPWKELKKVTFIVDPNDDVHEAISFTGPVHRD
jgi:PBP1b-binding outer membrane lipoprotein LpoB